MKRTIGTILVCLFTVCSQAQSLVTKDQSTVKTKGFIENFEQAKKEAAAFKQPVFAFFTGSDWCGWCIKLHREVIDTQAFKKFADDNLILFEADFPNAKKQSSEIKQQNNELLNRFGVQGFPTVLLLDAEGKLLGRTGYQSGGGEAYVKSLKDLLEKAGVKTVDKPDAGKAPSAGK